MQALLRSISFTVASDTPSPLDRTVRIQLTDGDEGTSNLPTKLVKVVPVNDSPVISAFDGTVTYTENAAPVVLDSNAVVTDVDSFDFATGKLTVVIVANYQSTDKLGIKSTGTAVGQISLNGSEVSYGGVVIGTFTTGSSLVVEFNNNATRLAVQALLRSITFTSITETPSPLDRVVRVSLTDGDGGTSNLPTKLVKVVPVNDAPLIGAFDGTVTYTENAAPVVLDSNAVVTDVDSFDFATGKLTVAIVANYQSTDVLGIRVIGTAAGQISVSGREVSYGGVVIGTFTRGSSLVVTFNSNATRLAVQALLRSITFASATEMPSPLDRTVRVSLTDGDGGTSNLSTKIVKVVPVNDVPLIGAFDGTVTYTENSTPVVLDSNAVVTDIDSANFATGRLSVAIVTNYQSTDVLGIRTTGTAAGQISVSDSNVSYGGVVIGTFTRGSSLVVTFNSNATRLAVQALLRSITFTSVTETPSPLIEPFASG